MDDDAARIDASQRDEARHSLTTAQAAELFAQLGVPRSKRSVQRFCESGHLDFVSVKGPRGDEFFISSLSVKRYAEELRQIDAIATIADEARHDAAQRDTARHDAPQRDRKQTQVDSPERGQDTGRESAELKRREDEIMNLRIDNRAKEHVITMLRDERREMQVQLQDVAYRLGASESRIALLEASKSNNGTSHLTATTSGIESGDPTADPPIPKQGNGMVPNEDHGRVVDADAGNSSSGSPDHSQVA